MTPQNKKELEFLKNTVKEIVIFFVIIITFLIIVKEWLFRVTGIQWIIKKIYPNCNCDKRRDKLNEFKINRK
jgi:hypothetical protein